jgi:hypothetical protein
MVGSNKKATLGWLLVVLRFTAKLDFGGRAALQGRVKGL